VITCQQININLVTDIVKVRLYKSIPHYVDAVFIHDNRLIQSSRRIYSRFP